MGVKWYLILVLISVLLMANVEHLFIYVLDICVSSLEMHLFRSFAIFKLDCPVFLGCKSLCICRYKSFIRYRIYKYSVPFCNHPRFLDVCFFLSSLFALGVLDPCPCAKDLSLISFYHSFVLLFICALPYSDEKYHAVCIYA